VPSCSQLRFEGMDACTELAGDLADATGAEQKHNDEQDYE
jgi:hypothetical protein